MVFSNPTNLEGTENLEILYSSWCLFILAREFVNVELILRSVPMYDYSKEYLPVINNKIDISNHC